MNRTRFILPVALLVSAVALTACSGGAKEASPGASSTSGTPTLSGGPNTTPEPPVSGEMLWSPATGKKVAGDLVTALNAHDEVKLKAMFVSTTDPALSTKILDASKGKTYTLKDGKYTTGESPQQGVMVLTLNDGKKPVTLSARAYPNLQKQSWELRLTPEELTKFKG